MWKIKQLTPLKVFLLFLSLSPFMLSGCSTMNLAPGMSSIRHRMHDSSRVMTPIAGGPPLYGNSTLCATDLIHLRRPYSAAPSRYRKDLQSRSIFHCLLRSQTRERLWIQCIIGPTAWKDFPHLLRSSCTPNLARKISLRPHHCCGGHRDVANPQPQKMAFACTVP